MEFHMMNVIYAALSISAQTEKRRGDEVQEGDQPGYDDQLVEGDEFHEGNQLNKNYDEENIGVDENNGGNQPKYGTVGGDGGLTRAHNSTEKSP